MLFCGICAACCGEDVDGAQCGSCHVPGGGQGFLALALPYRHGLGQSMHHRQESPEGSTNRRSSGSKASRWREPVEAGTETLAEKY